MPPPTTYRRAERDNQDLRRVASLQYARRPPSPAREYGPYADPRIVEPAPYEVIERPYVREPAYRESSIRPDGSRHVRVPRSPSPPRAADPYTRIGSPAMMPPPPARQVVYDEHGNKFYMEPAAPAAPVDYRYSVSRRVEPDPRYERATTRAPAIRPMRVTDPYEEDVYRGMPPPPSKTRAFSHVPDAEVIHRERAFSVRPQAAPAARHGSNIRGGFADHEDEFVRPPPPRFEEAPREYVPRAFSVHPEASRREVVPEYSSRPGSVHPEAYIRRMPPPPMSAIHPREQVVVDDGYRYAAPVPQHARYVEDVEPMEEAYGDGRRVVSYRY